MNYYIQGDAANAEKIKAAFEKLGYNTGNLGFTSSQLYYTIEGKVELMRSEAFQNLIKAHPNYKELKLPVEPMFKVGDSLQSGSHFTKILSINLEEGRYYCDNRIISFKDQDLWHLVPKPNYDIANFKPFDKVLVRDDDTDMWTASLYSNYDKITQRHFVAIDSCYYQCIPFNNDTKHLLGTTDMCDEMYINW